MQSRKLQALTGLILIVIPFSFVGLPEILKTIFYICVGSVLLFNALRNE